MTEKRSPHDQMMKRLANNSVVGSARDPRNALTGQPIFDREEGVRIRATARSIAKAMYKSIRDTEGDVNNA